MAEERKDGLVSIVIPVYNGAEFLEETVRSVQNQTYTNWELLLVDDCSGDGSRDLMERLAKEDTRIRCLFQEKNAGAAQARNRGIREATGSYLSFLDADDLWVAQKLEKELSFLKEKQAEFVFSGYEFADEAGRGTGKVVKVPAKLTYRQALKNTTIFTSTVLFHLDKLGKELVSMPDVKSEDTATWWKVLRAGYVAWGLPENLVYYRRSKGTLSANKVSAISRIWNLYREVEGLSVVYSFYNFCFYAVRAVLRRI